MTAWADKKWCRHKVLWQGARLSTILVCLSAVPAMTQSTGAQGTLYSTGSINGMIRFIPSEPDPMAVDFSGSGTVSDTRKGDRLPNVPLDSDALVNLKAGIENDHWGLPVFIKNLFDNRAKVDAINSAQDPFSFITVQPFTIGARAGYRF